MDIGNDGSGEGYVYTDGYVALTGSITNRNAGACLRLKKPMSYAMGTLQL